MPPPDAPPDARGSLRQLAFIVILAAMVAVPLFALFSEHEAAQHVGWRMFRTTATAVCVVRYEHHRPGAPAETLDRFSALGHTDPDSAPMTLVRIATADDAHFYARELCAALGEGQDVRMHLRCATEDGYDVVTRGERNLCP